VPAFFILVLQGKTMDTSNNLDQLVIARRLILLAQQAEDRRNGKKVEEKSLKDNMEADQVLLSGNAPVEAVETQPVQPTTDDTTIKLSDLIAQLKELQTQSSPSQQVQVSFKQTVEINASFSYTKLEKVNGLVRNSQNEAETDRYRFEFLDGITFKITDKWTNRSTTIWGDPHVDVDDVAGDRDGDFQDLKSSNSQTTFMLQDNTRVTITAKDDGLIEAVDIFKDSQHLTGTGQGSTLWSEENGLFASAVDKNTAKASSLSRGDTVYAGGDGNDWFTSAGQLVWGQTTGPTVTSRPYATMQMEYHEKITQEVQVQVNTQA
jgi:hypothetical protein